MTRQRPLILPVTVTGLSLLIFPFIEVGYSSTPMRVGDAIWRFGVEGIISGTMFFPMLGLLMLVVAASMTESTGANRAVAITAGIFAGAIVILCAAFVLDVLQVKAGAAPRVYPAMKKAAISALMRDGFAFAGFVACAVSARRSLRMAKAAGPGKSERGRIIMAPPAAK